ncbi:hypothetical protein Tco_0234616 [Tanacetum coccineum]
MSCGDLCLSGFIDALDFSTGIYLFVVLWDFASLFSAEARGFNLERKAFVSYVLLSEHLCLKPDYSHLQESWSLPYWGQICLQDQKYHMGFHTNRASQIELS